MDGLYINKGARSLCLRTRTLINKEVIIGCREHWESMYPDFEDEELQDAAYYLDSNEIDQLIAKLQEAKKFLNSQES